MTTGSSGSWLGLQHGEPPGIHSQSKTAATQAGVHDRCAQHQSAGIKAHWRAGPPHECAGLVSDLAAAKVDGHQPGATQLASVNGAPGVAHVRPHHEVGCAGKHHVIQKLSTPIQRLESKQVDGNKRNFRSEIDFLRQYHPGLRLACKRWLLERRLTWCM